MKENDYLSAFGIIRNGRSYSICWSWLPAPY